MRFQPGQNGDSGRRPRRTPYADAHSEVAQLTVHALRILPIDSVALATAKSVARQALRGKISAAADAANRAESTPRQRPEVLRESPKVVLISVDRRKVIDSEAEQAADSLPPSDGDSKTE
jgi:hypothetical protein